MRLVDDGVRITDGELHLAFYGNMRIKVAFGVFADLS